MGHYSDTLTQAGAGAAADKRATPKPITMPPDYVETALKAADEALGRSEASFYQSIERGNASIAQSPDLGMRPYAQDRENGLHMRELSETSVSPHALAANFQQSVSDARFSLYGESRKYTPGGTEGRAGMLRATPEFDKAYRHLQQLGHDTSESHASHITQQLLADHTRDFLDALGKVEPKIDFKIITKGLKK